MEKGKATDAEIEVWKGKHKNVFEFVQTDEDGNVHYTYCRKPKLPDIQLASQYADKDPIKGGITMFNSCRLGGSEEVVNDDEMKLGVIAKLGKLFKKVEASEKKL